jgi:hypothetical protein
MSRLGAGFGAGIGVFTGGAAGVGVSGLIDPKGYPEAEHALGWGLVGAVLGAIVGASLGAGCPACPTAKTGVAGVGEPLADPRFP